jgi:hypothetical protein
LFLAPVPRRLLVAAFVLRLLALLLTLGPRVENPFGFGLVLGRLFLRGRAAGEPAEQQ